MNPWKVSAQFAAFVWYLDRNCATPTRSAEAALFARENWIAFLPYAHEGYGRLLIRIARMPASPSRRASRSRLSPSSGAASAEAAA